MPAFASGPGMERSKRSSAIGRRRLKTLFDKAKVAGGHAHRFRDTFATETLLVGLPLERVSILLGHSSIRIRERHYSPWVRARQEQLERTSAQRGRSAETVAAG